ncbi:MAG: hypothetical protein KGI45_02805 [Patescibacteria group bacterium]|nr:hypothetical protein [Patescibacteria group bacterium]MDE1966976.1 hypothetical protein [Patescibacteria group bacterium]
MNRRPITNNRLEGYEDEYEKAEAEKAASELLDWNTRQGEKLLKAFSCINNRDFARSFLDDLFTKKELENLIERLEIAELILIGTPYKDICLARGISSKTVSRLSRRLRGWNSGLKQAMRHVYPEGLHIGN